MPAPKTLFLLALWAGLVIGVPGNAASTATHLAGSGASFPYHIYSLWFMLFSRGEQNVDISYRAIGSGGGIKDLQQHKVDFAASDAAMTEKEMEPIKEGVQLLPMTAGEVVLIYNLQGIKALKLPREAYANIFLGKVKRWNDPVIVRANPGVELPDLEITVVGRVESSGTTFVFTNHLSAISQDFRKGPGVGKKVEWPKEVKLEKAPLNAGIIAAVKAIPGAIGYVDYGIASLVKIEMASLENREGHYIAPGLEGGLAALANGEVPADMIAWLPDPAGAKSYPITTYTWMMFYKKYQDPQKAQALREMIVFCLDEGQKIADKFGYIPLPPKVVEMVRAASANIQ